MASINKLSIRGIRAFSPLDDEQVVEFSFPCTIIVGSNGCGKTTIIESLKYAVTGGFPPGAKSGQAFVHDAKSVGQTTVKANVKLRFTSKSGQSMVVVRSMEVTQKKAKATFKQLDGVIKCVDPDTRERTSLSHKCSELDKLIPQLLGVSAPILEHVIFCHQEDSSWPLQEGAILKKKFDEIFDSTRYSKALDSFRKTEKEMLSTVKDLKADLAGLKSHKFAAETFRKELSEQTEQLETVDEMKRGISSKIGKAEEKLKEYEQIISQMGDVENVIESHRNEIAQEHMIIKKQKSILEEDLTTTHTLPTLKGMLRDFDSKVTSIVDNKESLEKKVLKIQQDIDEMRKEEMRLTSVIGKFAAEKEANEKRLRERFKMMEGLATKYNIDLNLSQLSQGSIISRADDDATQGNEEFNDKMADDSSVMTISNSDMKAFFEALEKKEMELKSSLKALRERNQSEEDAIQEILTDVGGKLKAVENDRMKLLDEKNDASREHSELASQASAHSRLRKSDIEDTRKSAEAAAKKRDSVSADPRKAMIPLEIRQHEQEIDRIKRQLEDDRLTLESLRHSSDAQNEMIVLKEQCEKDAEVLEDALREHSYTLQKYNIQGLVGGILPKSNEDEGYELLSVIDSIQSNVRMKYDDINMKSTSTATDVSKTQRHVAEKKAILASSHRSLMSHRSKLQSLTSSINDMRVAVENLRRHEASIGISLTATIDNPRELLQYVDKRLDDLEDDAPNVNAPKIARKLLKRLKKMSKVPVQNEEEFRLVCPCCRREMQSESEVEIFTKALNEMLEDSSPLVKADPDGEEAYAKAKGMYQTFRKFLSDQMENLRDSRRMTDECSDLENDSKRLEEEIHALESRLRDEEDKASDNQREADELRELLDFSKRWSESANRIAEKRIQINQKNLDLSATVVDSTRDLRTVERDMNNLMEEKDTLTNKINRLNKEMTQLNNTITQFTMQAASLDKLAREKEAKYSSEQKATERKAELLDRLKQIGEEEKKLQDQMGPLKSKIRAKEAEKQRLRTQGNEEERNLQTLASQFDNDIKRLDYLVRQIDAFMESSKSDELDELSSTIAKTVSRIEERKQRILELQPELDAARTAVLDQERHKNQLRQNIDILEAKMRLSKLETEINRLELKRDSINGHETAHDDYVTLKASKDKLNEDKARLDGRFSEIAESIRSLKRKLAAPEYKNVDEEYRVVTIKHTTTQIAADDLKKYASALDKALLQFHSVKIGEINKIIRDLWLLTYKGEDIGNIEIVSGQEEGSRAAKSYNYRVVMTKGSTQMDMRGRCSAGQRVLASIVIRLALAETFGISCGCIALDEPTVNLDYDNKRGLAGALAQIVSSRAQQRNFQLILITHDLEFVSMMKTELASMTGFSMPDKYFQVQREEGTDGKFYSKILSIDWDELL